MPCVLLALCALALAEPPPGHLRLPSGLEVLTETVHDDGQVQLELRLEVGAAEDPPGRSGLAHLAEHVTLLPGPQLPIGADGEPLEIEGVTTHDATRFLVRLAPESVESALRWVAVALSGPPAPAPRVFALEQSRVAAEALRRADDEPALRGLALYPPGHPYHRPAAGIPDELRALRLEDAQAFIAANYRPDRARLALAGELPEGTDALARELLGGLPAREDPPPTYAVAPERPAAWPERWSAVGERVSLTALFALGAETPDATDLLARLLADRLRDRGWSFDVVVIQRRLGDMLVARIFPPAPTGLLTRGAAGGWRARIRQAEGRIRDACADRSPVSATERASAEQQLEARLGRASVAVAARLALPPGPPPGPGPLPPPGTLCAAAPRAAWLALSPAEAGPVAPRAYAPLRVP